jgi:two-component system cell cycle response regulator DivK
MTIENVFTRQDIAILLDNRKILIAEDEYFNYLYLETILRGSNVSLLWAKNGREAVDLFKNNPSIDVILMDIKMPGLTGVEAVHEIRSLNDKVPVIAQTAYAAVEDGDNYLETGFNDYICKPIQKDELIGKIKKLLQV